MNLVFNLTSDILIMSIPLPLLVKARLNLKKKILLVFPFTLGLFTMLCAILSKRLSFTHPYSSEWVYWYCREASTAMIVSNMPYSWALVRKVFNLRSFFGDSTTAHMQAGEPRTLNGFSAGAVQLTSQTRSRQASQIEGGRGKLSFPRLKMSISKEEPADSWAVTKEIKVERTPTSSNTSSDGSAQKPQHTTTTEWTLDRLYPLDDQDLADTSTDTKGIKVGGTLASSNASSNASLRKPQQITTTDWTLDRLYPLDDEELTAPDPTHRRYEGV
jgi:hypothetical protein